MKKRRLIVIGGGAAGFFCAGNAARLNPLLEVIIVEKTSKLLSKVRISGGGRCNVTHACFDIAGMVKRYPRGANFVKKAFHHFFTTDTIAWFGQRGVELKAEADGRMFPVSNSSQTIINCLLQECHKYGVNTLMNREVLEMKRTDGRWLLLFSNASTLDADFICVAAGGYPKAAMFNWIQQLGHTVEEPVPSLFTFNMPGNSIRELMGVSVEMAQVKIAGTKLQESGPLLITHWGLSGPAILKLSAQGARELAALTYHFTVQVNWVPAYNENSLRDFLQHYRFEKATQKTGNKNPFQLPQRFWEYILQQCGIDANMRWADLPSREQNKLVKHLCNQEHTVHGKTTFKEEFVTAGGVLTSEIDPDTMMSKLVPGLFFAGEIINVDGVTGGFNFQHAWTSGWIAARAIVSQLE
jgi:predicted Rossmann fold flavoprotein